MSQISQSNMLAPNDAQVPPFHPKAVSAANLVLLALLSVFGAVIGIQLLVTLGVTPNTSIIGALIAMILARIPLQMLREYRSIHAQNLAQSAISAATFGAANSLLLPIAIPFLMGRADLVLPMFLGVALAMLLDAYMLYRMFNTKVFPASGAWPPGVAAAEAIKAGDKGGKQAALLGAGMMLGAVGSWFKIPMSAFGTAFIGNIWALSMFGIGLLLRGYDLRLFDFDISKAYIPHGMMIGAGLVALFQVGAVLFKKAKKVDAQDEALSRSNVGKTLRLGAIGYIVLAAAVSLIGGLYADMSLPMLIAFIFYAAFAAFVHELIVGIAAMHSGWFPAFAVALITLLLGLLLGFPVPALAVLCSFSVATGPAFADMGYDLKAGYILRGRGTNPVFELEGRKQQLIAAILAFLIAIPVVYIAHTIYFPQGLVPPVAKVYVATINAGVTPGIASSLLLWAVPGALIQLLGGPKRQLGVLLATGLLIFNPMAGWAVGAGIALRVIIEKMGGSKARGYMEVFAGGVIAGDALFSFFNATINAKFGKK
ncbi:OPT/YSL family transporter [Hydromonas duriensis]|uniref:Putative oligopeptide transporter (OPT) family protein n=1 Tax=Hydromonas duriensis TaxID=1527608 RepID=A0A4R6YBZ2_9BURK|nr:OPT/YSL family transporter [Hydromonas duriensis]TDR33088.1 putative oligopeptide transporter (OPT) family protein [Hydromonas duriensis]